jgi:hypothetical protein
MLHPYTEDQLVERPAIGRFAELGWGTGCALPDRRRGGAQRGLPAKLKLSELRLVCARRA